MSSREETPLVASNSSKSLWVAVGLLFGLMAVAWFTLFSLAADNPVETVPLEHLENS